MNKQATLFSEALILTMTDERPTPFIGWVGVVDNRITLVSDRTTDAEHFRAAHPDCREIACRKRLLMPGLINTHCHVAMTLQRNYADDIPLMAWLNDHIWPFEAQQTPDEVALGAELGIVEMLLGGVTSFVDMYWEENRIADSAHKLGIRALLCPSCLDSNMEQFEQDLMALLPKCNDRVRAGVGPHAPYTVNRENLLRTKDLAERYHLPLTIHIAETKVEMASVAAATGMTPVQWLDSLGLLTEHTIGAHCVYVDETDRQTLLQRGVKIAHNPSSNMKIASGIAPIESCLAEGLHPTIGTDGPCSNNDLDMWEEMRNTSFLAKVSSDDPLVLPAMEVLKMATVYGAEALGHAGELGIVREGALADLILIDLRKPHLQPINNLISDLVYCCKSSDVDSVMVDGRLLVENRRLTGVDLEQLYDRVTAAADRIKQTIGQQ